MYCVIVVCLPPLLSAVGLMIGGSQNSDPSSSESLLFLTFLTSLPGVETKDDSSAVVFLLVALPSDHLLLIDDDDKEEEDLFVIHSPLVGKGFFEVDVLDEKAKRLE